MSETNFVHFHFKNHLIYYILTILKKNNLKNKVTLPKNLRLFQIECLQLVKTQIKKSKIELQLT